MYAEIVILAMLMVRPQHGYEIKKQVEYVLGEAISINNKVLYPALKHFEEMGAVRREIERQEGKPDRHIYSITERGIEILQALLRDFSPSLAGSSAEFLTRVSFFDLLEPEGRLDILATRAAAVRKRLEHLQDLKALASKSQLNTYAEHVLSFQVQLHQQELDWIQMLVQEAQAAKER